MNNIKFRKQQRLKLVVRFAFLVLITISCCRIKPTNKIDAAYFLDKEIYMWQSKDNLERSFELIWDDDRLENSRNFSQYYAFLDTKKDSNFHPINLTFGLVCNSLIYFGASSNFSNFEQANEIFVKIKQKMKARKGAISLKEENSTYIECDFGDVNEIGSLRIVGNKYFFSYSLYVKEYEHLVQ